MRQITLDEVRQWANALGFEFTAGRARQALIARYNREHPKRQFVSKAHPFTLTTSPNYTKVAPWWDQ
jgi:hypothetical protein